MDRESPAPDVIEKEMEQTRVSLTDKVAALEQQVVGTIQNATETVNTTVESVQSTVESMKSAVEDTMSSVKGSVTESVAAVTDSVKSTLDFSSHVRERPWEMVGGAAVAGFLLGMILPGGRSGGSLFGSAPLGFQQTPGTPRPPSPSYAAEASRPSAGSGFSLPTAASMPSMPATPSWVDDLLSMAGKEIRKLGEEALTVAVTSLRQSLHEQVPHLVENGIMSATQAFTQGRGNDAAAGRGPAGPRAGNGSNI